MTKNELTEMLKALEVIPLTDRVSNIMEDVSEYLNNKYESEVIYNKGKNFFTIIPIKEEEELIKKELYSLISV